MLSGNKASKDIDFDYIPADGESIPVLWKHNLAGGAKASTDIDALTKEKLSKIAILSADTVELKFASVDIVQVNASFKVMEINSGVMMEKMPSFVLNGEALAKSIYKTAVSKMFNIPQKPAPIQEKDGFNEINGVTRCF